MGEHLVTKEQVESAKKKYEELEKKLQAQAEKKLLRTVKDYCAVSGKTVEEFEVWLREKTVEKKAQKSAPENVQQAEHVDGAPGTWEAR